MADGPGKKIAADGHEYHKSATANAPVAPTNEATLANVTKSGGITSYELDFVTNVHYEFSLTGEIDPLSIATEYNYELDEVKELIKKPHIVQALKERGINALRAVGLEETNNHNPPGKAIKRTKLTPVQLVVANMMLDLTDNRSEKKKLQDVGVSTAQYQMWLRDPDFNNYLKERAENLIGDVQHEAMLSLVDNVRAGKMDAIKYYHELTGRFVPQSANQAGSGTQQNFQQMVISIVEIIIDEVEDPQVAARISDRLKGLIMGNQVAGVLASPEPIVKPEIAPARVITPEVQDMMNKGLGYNS